MVAVHAGSWAGLPDFGITEKIQSMFQPSKPMTTQGGSNLFGPTPQSQAAAPSSPTVDSSPINRSIAPSPTGSVLGTSTSSSGGGTPSAQPNYSGAPMESTPQQDSINWDEIYQPAFDALNQADQAQQSSYQSGMGDVQAGYDTRSADLQNEAKTRTADYEGQKATETGRTDTAVAEARRMAAQLLQGLQSQYGGSTGTGAFRGEQVGAAASQNISGNKVALQTALTGISGSENALKDKVISLQNAEDQNLQNSKLQLKAQLDKALADIAGQRGQLSVDKGAKRMDALQNYKNLVAEVEARNTAFKQQLYTEAQKHAEQLAQLKSSVNDKYSAGITQPTFGSPSQVGPVTPTAKNAPVQFINGKQTNPNDIYQFPNTTQGA